MKKREANPEFQRAADPLINAMIAHLPPAGASWAEAERFRWATMFRQCLEFVYPLHGDADDLGAPAEGKRQTGDTFQQAYGGTGLRQLREPLPPEEIDRLRGDNDRFAYAKIRSRDPDLVPEPVPDDSREESGEAPTRAGSTAGNPNFGKVWSEEEMAIIRQVLVRGGQVADAMAELPGRTREGIKTRFYAMRKEMRRVGEIVRIQHGARTKPNVWTEEELGTLKAIISRDGTVHDAVAAIKTRTESSVNWKFFSLRKAMREEEDQPEDDDGRDAAETTAPELVDDPAPEAPPEPEIVSEPEPEPEPKKRAPEAPAPAPAPTAKAPRQPKPTNPPPAETAPKFDASQPYQDRAIQSRLNALGYVKPWDAEMDAELVELFLKGSKAADVAIILELTHNQVVDRFKRLCPDTAPDAQRQVFRILQDRAAARRRSA